MMFGLSVPAVPLPFKGLEPIPAGKDGTGGTELPKELFEKRDPNPAETRREGEAMVA
jgi:hypothetical protein